MSGSVTIPAGNGPVSPVRLVITRNHCLGYARAGVVVGVLAAMPVFIGLVFYSLGFWMILPFAGLEILALAAGFFACIRHNNDLELVEVEDAKLRIYRRIVRSETRVCFPTCWTRLVLEISAGWYPSRLWVQSAGRQIELGRWLTEQEREELHGRLKKLIEV